MTLQSSVDVGIINNADGAQITGGDIARTLAWLGGNIAFTTAGDAVHTLPATNSVLLSNQPGEISALTAKNPPLGADILLIEDSAASFAKKKLSITNLLNSGLIATLGGWTIGETTISADDLTLDSDMPAIKMGAATDYLTGIGAFMGQSGSIYKFSLGDPNGKYIAFDGTGLASGGIWLSGKNLDLNNVPVLNDITWTDNSPTAGKVAWSEFHLTYMGLTYTVVAGNTDKKFLWWNKATSTTALQSSNTPPDLANDQFMVALNYSGTRQTALFSSFIYSDFIKVTNLAAISADMGTITAGTITGATVRTAASGTRLNLNTSELAAYLLTAKTVSLQTDGDLFIGTDVSGANTTSLSVFTNAQTYNSESMGAGDILIGSNSSTYANMMWDASAKKLLFRGGTTTQAYIDTDGSIKFGVGVGWLDATGLTYAVQDGFYTPASAVRWTYSGYTPFRLDSFRDAADDIVYGELILTGNAAEQRSDLKISADNNSGNAFTSLELYADPTAADSYAQLNSVGTVNIAGANVGITGALTVNNSSYFWGTITYNGGSGGALAIGTPTGETGLTYGSSNRADIRYNDSRLFLGAIAGRGVPTGGISIANGGAATFNSSTTYYSYGGTIYFIASDASGQFVFRTAGSSNNIFTITTGGDVHAPVGSLFAGGDAGAGTSGRVGITNVTSGVSTGTGTVKMNSVNNANSSGWLKIWVGTAAKYMPYWTSNAP